MQNDGSVRDWGRRASVGAIVGLVVLLTGCQEQKHPVGAIPSDQGPPAAGAPSAADNAPTSAPPAAGGGDSQAHMDEQGRLIVAGLAWPIPSGWHPRAPETPFADWEFLLPGPEEPALLTMGTIGGDVTDNFRRWHGQLGLDGASLEEAIRRVPDSRVPVTFYSAAGELGGQPDMMIAGMFLERGDRPDGPPLAYVKVVGPAATIRRHLEAIEQFGRSAQLVASSEPSEQDE